MRLNELLDFEKGNEEVSIDDLNALERYLDRFYKNVGLDIDIHGRHFLERINDARNGKQITIAELKNLFGEVFNKYAENISKKGDDFQGVLVKMTSDINVPFVIHWDNKNKEFDLKAKTIMRKKGFQTNDPKFVV